MIHCALGWGDDEAIADCEIITYPLYLVLLTRTKVECAPIEGRMSIVQKLIDKLPRVIEGDPVQKTFEIMRLVRDIKEVR